MRRVLRGGGLTVCAEVRDVRTALVVAEREQPDLCLLADAQDGGFGAIRELRRRVPRTVIVVLGDASRVDRAFGALYAGAAGFLPDEMSVERMPRALRGALSGEAALPRRLVAQLIEEFRRERRRARLVDSLHERGAELTRRQSDVLELLAEGMTTAQIAETLAIADATVRSHIAAALAKLHVSTRAAAVDMLKRSV
jgi:DNA-binding NarL/FixJ family response regulator